MSWEDQGRQEHGWFGHGTAPPHLTDDHDRSGRFGPGGLDERIRAIGMCAIAGLPARLRYHHAARIEGAELERFARVMRAWVRGLRLDRARFAAEFFGASPNYPAAEHLRHAAWFAATALGSADIREATDHLAAVMQEVGLDRWRRCLGDAEQRAAPVPVKPPATVLASAAGVLSMSDAANGAAAGSGAGLGALARSGAAALPRAAMVLGPLGVPLAVLGVLWPKQVADDTLTGLGIPIGGGAPVGGRGPNTVSTPAAPALPRGVSTPAPGGSQGPQVTATPAAPALPSAQQGRAGDGLQGPQVQAMARPRVTPEEMERQRQIIASKGLPTGGSNPYEPTKEWTSSQPLPRGRQKGYLDAYGNERVKARGRIVGEPHWDVQTLETGHLNVKSDGEIAHGRK